MSLTKICRLRSIRTSIVKSELNDTPLYFISAICPMRTQTQTQQMGLRLMQLALTRWTSVLSALIRWNKLVRRHESSVNLRGAAAFLEYTSPSNPRGTNDKHVATVGTTDRLFHRGRLAHAAHLRLGIPLHTSTRFHHALERQDHISPCSHKTQPLGPTTACKFKRYSVHCFIAHRPRISGGV